jgi:hypothetical protein
MASTLASQSSTAAAMSLQQCVELCSAKTRPIGYSFREVWQRDRYPSEKAFSASNIFPSLIIGNTHFTVFLGGNSIRRKRKQGSNAQ